MIEHMRTYFAGAGHTVDSVTFATGMLRQLKQEIQRQFDATGFIAKELLDRLSVELGDPARPVNAPVVAYVNASHWLARCECGGAEFVDLEQPLFMCCSCWNKDHGYSWRTVVLPLQRMQIEAVLLARADPATRSWRPDETVADLVAENEKHGVKA